MPTSNIHDTQFSFGVQLSGGVIGGGGGYYYYDDDDNDNQQKCVAKLL